MIRVIGVPELLARLARAAVVGQVAETATKAALAQEIAADARARAPVVTGRLRDSITADGDSVGVGVDYAPFVEYGTATMAAEPYLRPAADEAQGSTTAEAAGAAVLRSI